MAVVDLHADEAGSGRPVVLLHAFPLSSSMWSEQRAGLADACRVVTPDLRGFGGSPLGDDPPDIDLMADDVAALMDRRGLDRAVIGGLSMGGYVAMAFARRHADRLGGVILADTKASADDEAARSRRHRIAGELDATRTPQVLVDDVLPTLTGDVTKAERPDVVRRLRDAVTATAAPAAAWAQRAMAARPDSSGTLRSLRVPALVIVGDEDALTPPAEINSLTGSLADVRVVVLPRCGHLSALEDPPLFTSAVREFVTSQP